MTVKSAKAPSGVVTDDSLKGLDLDACIDAMNADGSFFLGNDGVKLPAEKCSKAFDFCSAAQKQLCGGGKDAMACGEEVRCRHLIRQCYIDNYDSR